jgi:NitT/TauT family transport system substrate-binding protein
MPIVLQESLRALFYAPFYAALAHGAYATAGVDVRFVTAPRPGDAARGLFDGTVDVCWGGPMRVMETYKLLAGCDLVSFAEVVTRDPFLLVGRVPRPEFRLADLLGLRIATVGEVPTPWMCLQEDLRRAGIAPGRLDRVGNLSMTQNIAALRAGEVDVVQLFEPFVSSLITEGAGHVWYAAATRGPTSYTTLYARRGLLTTRREELRCMVRAIHRTQLWVAGATAAQIADAIADYFSDVPATVRETACARYQALGIWSTTPLLPRQGYDRLLSSLVSGGFVAGTSFEVAVDNTLAEEVMIEPTA